MRVKCTSTGNYCYLTIGREYPVVDQNESSYYIPPYNVDDNFWYEKHLFEVVPEPGKTTYTVKELTEALTALDVAYSNVKHLLNFKGE